MALREVKAMKGSARCLAEAVCIVGQLLEWRGRCLFMHGSVCLQSVPMLTPQGMACTRLIRMYLFVVSLLVPS